MADPPSRALKGRDLDAIHGFARRLRAAVPDAVREVRFLGFRTLDVPAEAAAPSRRGPPSPPPPASPAGPTLAAEPRRAALAPLPRPPSELVLGVLLERRDVFVEEQIDEVASQLSRELGTVVAPFAYTVEEWEERLRGTRLAETFDRGEVLA